MRHELLALPLPVRISADEGVSYREKTFRGRAKDTTDWWLGCQQSEAETMSSECTRFRHCDRYHQERTHCCSTYLCETRDR